MTAVLWRLVCSTAASHRGSNSRVASGCKQCGARFSLWRLRTFPSAITQGQGQSSADVLSKSSRRAPALAVCNARGAMLIRPRGRPWLGSPRAGRRRGHRGRGLPTGIQYSTVHMQAAQLQRSIGLADVRRGCSQASGNGGLQTQRSAARSARQAQAQTQAQAQAGCGNFLCLMRLCTCSLQSAVCASPVDTDTQTHRH